MILNQDQVRSIVSGILNITEEHGYLCFHRYHASQEEYYEDNNFDFHRKCYATAGVRMDFVTDSASLSFEYELHIASSRRFYFFDVYADGKLIGHEGEEQRSARKGVFRCRLPEGKKRVTVWFPCMYAVLIRGVRLDDGCFFEGVRYERTLLAIGDSITHGYDAKYACNAYPARLATHFEWNVINQGIGGDVYHAGNLGDGVGFCPDFVTVALGTNDWSNRKKDRFDFCVTEFYEKLARLYPEAKIAVITPFWRSNGDRVTNVGTFAYAADKIREAAGVCPNLTVLNGLEMLAHDPALFSPDVLHPNDAGFADMTERLIPALEKAFGVK